jgi:hypothetical protein
MFRKTLVPTEKLNEVLLAKWPADVLCEGYTPLPKRLLRCCGRLFPGPAGLELMAAILAVIDYRRPRQSRAPSVEYLAFCAGLEPARFTELLDSLKERGWAHVSGNDQALTIDLSGLMGAIRDAAPVEGEARSAKVGPQ